MRDVKGDVEGDVEGDVATEEGERESSEFVVLLPVLQSKAKSMNVRNSDGEEESLYGTTHMT